MHFNEKLSALPMENFRIHDVFVFVLTSLRDAAEQLQKPELNGESLRLENFLQIPSEQVTEMIILGKRLSIVQNNNFGVFATIQKKSV